MGIYIFLFERDCKDYEERETSCDKKSCYWYNIRKNILVLTETIVLNHNLYVVQI